MFLRSPCVAAGPSALRLPRAPPIGRRARRPSGWRWAVRCRSAPRAPATARVVFTPSATIFMPARMSCSRRPRASSSADVAVAAEPSRARQHEVAEAAQAGGRLPAASGGAGQPRDFGQAARDQRRQRVVSQPESFDHAGGDRDDVLHRAADLDADDVPRPVQAEVTSRGTLPGRDQWLASDVDAARTAVGASCATSTAKLGPESTTTGRSVPSSCAITSDIRRSVSVSRPLVALTMVARGRMWGAASAHHRPAAVRWNRRQPRCRCLQARPSSAAVTGTPSGSEMSGRYTAFARRARSRRRAADRAPTTGPHDRCGPDEPRVPCPNRPRRVPRSFASALRNAAAHVSGDRD